MTSDEKLLSKIIRNVESVILEDGRVDMAEAGMLLRWIRPLADEYGSDFRAFEQALRDVREDGVITPEESERLRQLIAAMADRVDDSRVIECPECKRPLSVRATAKGTTTTCPWCGRDVQI